jgi:tight adherence protein B
MMSFADEMRMLNFSGTILLVGLVILLLVGIVLVLLLRLTSPTGELQERIHIYAWIPDEVSRRQTGTRPGRFYRMRRRLNVMLSSLGSDDMNMQLMAANWQISVTEYILIRIGLMVGGLALGWLAFGTPVSGLALAVMANLLPGMLLRRRSTTAGSVQSQLVDVLVLIQGAVRSGFSLLQALEVVVRETEAPAADEFKRVTREVSLGITLSQALNNLRDRMQNADLSLIVTAVNIHNQVGGNLTTMINAVTETVRDRDRLFREARNHTQQRYTAYMLSLMPVFLAVMIFMLSPEYITQLLRPGPFILIPIFAVVGIILGHIVLQRITKIEV